MDVPRVGDVPPPDVSKRHDSDQENTNSANNPKPLGILFKARCNESGKLEKLFYSAKPFKGLDLDTINDQEGISAIEVILDIRGQDITGKPSEMKASHRFMKGDNIDFRTDFIPEEIKIPEIHVHSRALQMAFRKLIQYYPSQLLTGTNVRIRRPYGALMHYFEELRAYRDTYSGHHPDKENHPGRDNDSARLDNQKYQGEACSEETARDLGILLEYLWPDYRREVIPELRNYEQSMPVATFDMLWLLFKPGEDVYTKVGERLQGFVVESAELKLKAYNPYGAVLRNRKDRYNRYIITVWRLAYTGRSVYREKHKFSILEYQGERDITSLDIYPARFLDKTDGGVIRRKLETQGTKYYELIKKCPRHMTYQGMTLPSPKVATTNPPQAPSRWYHGQIIVDPKAYKQYYLENIGPHMRRPPPPRDNDDSEDEDTDWLKEPGDFGGGVRWSGYNNIDPKRISTLTKHQWFLLPSVIEGFMIKEKAWMMFDIEAIREVEWPCQAAEAMNHLVMPPEREDMEMLKALSRHKDSKRSESVWHADFIQGKGEGQIFLLHGPPGTGKTYTVECIGEYTRRPLLSLTVADIGTVETVMEYHLTKFFNLAASWGAVLLIDEADVFLKKRLNSDNITRNGLVSVFLRSMEYYTGMLFLTTNRLGDIDDAFLSRIQVAIGYESLSDDARTHIWNNFFRKLKKERSDIIITERAKIFVRTDLVLKKLELNGREIRNALQTAIALATHEADSNVPNGLADIVEVSPDHFQQVIERRRVFIEDTNAIMNMTLEERALNEGIRKDRNLKNAII